eukprot:CAMPEP_0178451802 /NCGR_PEP_ID=MMETSP0689_2-20121128/43889_1 /TAXON_ID=160604 /ORGANISM="Amphidinium massartii, Strain CS-259" /LENGTH=721 /DNA_ID=CAMNT_0020077433 /DNA_START=76 /DNA_END=2237 /DNA_ORIENTATION=+
MDGRPRTPLDSGDLQASAFRSGDAAPSSDDVKAKGADIIYEMMKGNRRFVAGKPMHQESRAAALDVMMEDPYRPVDCKALVITCAYLTLSVESIFDSPAGELKSIRVMGFFSEEHDGVMGSVECALSEEKPTPVLLVLGNSDSEPIQAALRHAMKMHGRSDAPPSAQKLQFVEEEKLALVQKLLPACHDALLQSPKAPFEKLVEVAAKLNVWQTIQNFMSKSPITAQRVADGLLEIHGAYINMRTGAVQMLGEHPSKVKLLKDPPAPDVVRTASSPPVPAEEALAALVAGNRRYHSKRGGAISSADNMLLMQLSEGGQNPIAAILGCADSRAPVEILFDMRPGDLFVLRTAGNAIANAKGSLIGSAEYAIAHLHTKLLVVTGHTKCGAVTEAVKAIRANVDLKQVAGSIGNVLANIADAAAEAVQQLPHATVSEQVNLATKLNVFDTVRRLIAYSDIVKRGVATMDLQVHGAIYDIFSGKVEWLGQHPKLEEVVGQRLPLHTWKVSPYVPREPAYGGAQEVIDSLKRGNFNFMAGGRSQTGGIKSPDSDAEPSAIIVYGTEVRVKAQKLFDAAPGDFIVQRCLGNIVGVEGGTLFSSLEFAVERFFPKVLLILGYTDSQVIKDGCKQVQGSEVPPPAMRRILDRISVSAVRALKEVGDQAACTAAGSEMQVMRLSVVFNVLYAMERLMLTSPIIRKAMNLGMELQGAILDHVSGEVEFMGA